MLDDMNLPLELPYLKTSETMVPGESPLVNMIGYMLI